MRILQWSWTLLLFLIVAVSATEPMVPEHDYSGLYEVVGFEGESAYSGVAIIKKKGEGYHVQWTSDIGLNTIGFMSVEDNKFHASWVSGSALGQTQYTASKDKKTLEGRWMVSGKMSWNLETLRFIKKLPAPPEKT